MIKIFNKRTNRLILIDETLPEVSFEPNHWQDQPHVIIKLDGIHFSHHAENCDDCGSFRKSFGTDTSDWYIEYLGTVRRLNLLTLGQDHDKNHLVWTTSNFFCGSILKLNIDTDTIESLQNELRHKETIEDYEGCSKILNKIQSIS